MWFKKTPKRQQKRAIEELPPKRDWRIVTRSYAPPRQDLPNLSLSEALSEKAAFGVTTYLWEDAHTGDLRKEELLGNDFDELADLVEKVEKSGMQYIKMNGNVYAIARWVPPANESVPIK
jgi:hypothetical protein